MTQANTLRWDPYDRDIALNPYPTYKRLREEAPFYYNEQYDFYAVSRYADVDRCFQDPATYTSGYGDILELIKARVTMPHGIFIHQDPPIHTSIRGLMQKIITPKRMNALEPQIRALCARALDPVVGKDKFDFIANLGADMPMRVIGMLLGIPEEDMAAVRQMADDQLRTEAGKPMPVTAERMPGADAGAFEEYVKWRETHPSDDMMTELLHSEFTDSTGKLRKLHRDELLAIVNVVAGAGNETTNRLIGWTGKVLAEHPDQRREIKNNPGLIPKTIEELLRFEPPGPAVARYVAKDAEVQGKKIPAGSAMVLLVASANRDEGRFAQGDTFNIHREERTHLGFGRGIHVCIGAALARLEGRIALEEVMKRFTDWEVDYENAELSCTSTVRGWDTLPVWVGSKPKNIAAPKAASAAATAIVDVPLEGSWNLAVKGPTGVVPTVLVLKKEGAGFTGSQSGQGSTTQISDFKREGNKVSWINHVTSPFKMKVEFSGELSGNTLSGKAKAGFIGKFSFTGVKA